MNGTGPLTARQAELLEAVAEYGGIAPAAARLAITYQTAKNELRAIHAKLGVHTTMESFFIATRRGWIGRRP